MDNFYEQLPHPKYRPEIWDIVKMMKPSDLDNSGELHIWIKICEYKRRAIRNEWKGDIEKRDFNFEKGKELFGRYVVDGIDKDRPLPEGVSFDRDVVNRKSSVKKTAGTWNETLTKQWLPSKGGGPGSWVLPHEYAQKRPLHLLHNRWLSKTRKLDRSELKDNGFAEKFIKEQGILMGITFPPNAINYLTFNKNKCVT